MKYKMCILIKLMVQVIIIINKKKKKSNQTKSLIKIKERVHCWLPKKGTFSVLTFI